MIGSGKLGALAPFALALLLGSPASGESGTGSESLDSIFAAKRRDDRSRDDIVRELVALGVPAIPDLFELHAGLVSDEEHGYRNERRWWCGPDQFGDIALEALRGLPAADVVAYLRRREALHDDEPAYAMLASVNVLGRLQDVRGLSLVIEIASGVPQPVLRSRLVRSSFKDAIARIVSHDAKAVSRLKKLGSKLEADVLGLVVEGVCEANDPDAILFLTSLLGRSSDLDRLIIDGASRLEDRFAWRTRADVQAMVRARLPDSDAAMRRTAAIVCGRTRDVESFAELLEMLDDGSASVRTAALRALCEVSGLQSMGGKEEWERWLQGEVRWKLDVGDELLTDLQSAQPERVVFAVRTLGLHPLMRVDLADALSYALVESDESIVPGLCRSLARLDSRRAVPGLIELVETSTYRASRDSACAALRALTGEDFAGDVDAWRRFAFD